MERWFVILIAGLCVVLVTPRRAEYAQENVPVTVEAELKKARRCNQEGKAAEALKLLDGIKDKVDDAHRWAYHAHRGDALFELRRPSEALVEFEASVKADAKCWVQLRQAKALHVLGRWGEALVILDDVKPKDNEAAERDTLRLICDGPFKQRWPHAYRKLEATSGRFSVIANAGMQDAELDALDAKLAAIDTTTDEGKRAAEQLLSPSENAPKIARFLDDASKRFLETLKIDALKIPKGVAFRAFIVRGEERFRPIADVFAHDAHQFNEGEELVGLYSTSHKVLIVRDSGDKPDALTGLSPEILRTLLHEAWHQVFDAMCVTRPRWLDEGLAEYFAHIEREKDAIQFGALIREH
ncbi:MAG: hypothetical protein L6Q71_02960, partial [Planctomycetes bacterium]|nr:hypothetical protein [Planctomycetota bacterium]